MDESKLIAPLLAAAVAAVTFFGGVIAWFVRLERRLNNKLTIEKHEVLRKESDEKIEKHLAELRTSNDLGMARIIESVEDNNRVSSTFRHDVRGQLNVLALKVEVLSVKQDQVKEDLGKQQKKQDEEDARRERERERILGRDAR